MNNVPRNYTQGPSVQKRDHFFRSASSRQNDANWPRGLRYEKTGEDAREVPASTAPVPIQDQAADGLGVQCSARSGAGYRAPSSAATVLLTASAYS